MTGSRFLRLRAVFERLTDALCNPVRRERRVVALIIGYVAAWTLYGVLAKGSQGIHFDMAELADWGRHPVGGYYKHPPLAPWLVGAWFAVFPRVDWAYYLLTMSGVGVALWAAWRLHGFWLEGEKRVLALAVLSLMPLLSFHALKFNHNTVLIPLWALATLWFVRSYESRRNIDAALAGLAAGACMLTKYFSVFLVAGLALAALADRRRDVYFRSAAPWITAGVGLLVLAPHLAWLVANDFPPFSYALATHGRRGFGESIKGGLGYVVGIAAYAALPVLVLLAATRPSPAAWTGMLAPSDARVRFAVVAFWATLLLPVALALIGGTAAVAVWTMPAWTLLPVVLLWSPGITVTRPTAADALGFAMLFPLIMVLAAPVVAFAIHRSERPGPNVYYQPVAQATLQAWRAMTDAPLRYVGGEGNLSFGTAFYLPGRPSVFPEFNRMVAPWIDPAQVVRDGIALVCPMEASGCVAGMRGYAAQAPRAGIQELALANRYLGRDGVAKRFLIIVVPPVE